MAKKFDEMPDYQASLPRTGHSLSHDFGFTCTAAHLLPVFHDFVNPGETVTLGFDYKLRTQPLDAATMGKLKTHTEFFFVPMQLLYQGFSDWYYGIREEFSTRFNAANGNLDKFELPLLNLGNLFGQIFSARNSQAFGSEPVKVYGKESIANSAYRLFDMFGFRPKRIMNGLDQDSSLGSVFPYQLLAYNCIYQYYYRLDTRERFNPNSFNVDKCFSSGLIPEQEFVGYSLLHYRPMGTDYFTDVKISPIVDVLNLNNRAALDSATQFLTRSGKVSSGNAGNIISNEPFNSTFGNPSSYVQTQFGFKMINDPQRYIQVSPNSDYRDSNGSVLQSDYTGHVFRYSSLGQSYVDNNDALAVDVFHNHSVSGVQQLENGLDIGTANIRAMFASEKLWSITGRAKKTYDDQTLAHFGFNVPHDPKHSISCFGHDSSEIAIGEVISTANTGASGSPLGEIAGKGYGAQGSKRHKFTAPCHGVVMVIFSVVPEEYYTGTFLKANKFSDRSDLYTPEYDHLGMQPLFDYEVNPQSLTPQAIMGWQYRYQQWKRRYNRTTTVFDTNRGSLSSWIHTVQPYFGSIASNAQPNTQSYIRFLHSPNELDDIFLVNYNLNYSSTFATDPSAVYDTDPFVVNSHIDCVKVSTMSDYSLPRLDA